MYFTVDLVLLIPIPGGCLIHTSVTMFFLLTLLIALEVNSCPYAHVDPDHTMCMFKAKACSNKRLISMLNN